MARTVQRNFRLLAQQVFLRLFRQDLNKSRQLRFEPLETRQLMASDFFASASSASESTGVNDYLGTNGAQVAAVTTQAEGEAGQDLVAFAKLLRDSGIILFGADWHPDTTAQRALFQDGAQFLDFREVTNANRSLNALGTAETITTFPTWQFQGQRRTGILTLAEISSISGITIPTSSNPSFAPIDNVTVLKGSPFHIPVDAYDPNGNPLTITVSSSNPAAVSAEVLSGNKSARISVAGYGDMVFELFDGDLTRPNGRFATLAQQGFYNTTGSSTMTFHRVARTSTGTDFVIQGGDPTATGTGGSNLGNFDDEFDLNLQHNQKGVLSWAKSSDDTNNSQFFITGDATRFLDFNHSVFGQQIEGESVRAAINRTSVDSNSNPINDVVINSVTIFDDLENGLIRLKSLGAAGSTSTITVTVTDSEGNSTSRTFVVTVGNDNSNGSPFLQDIAPVSATSGQPVTFQLASQDKEGDTVTYTAVKPSTQTVNYTVSVNSTTGLVTVTPPSGFVGSFQVEVGVSQTTTANANDQFDKQLVTVNVAAANNGPSAPTSIDLLASSDSGTLDSDNITNATSHTFVVGGTTVGATVTLKAGSTVIGSTTATGTTTTITISNLATLGAGTYAITATQTVASQTSAASPVLNVTQDTAAPTALVTNPFPTSINAGQALTVDLNQIEENQGLVYSLLNPPNGMTVNPATGVVSWTPLTTQVGAQSFSLRLTDAAGNVTTTPYSITVTEAPLANFKIVLLDLNNNPLTSIAVGQNFKLQLIPQDLRNGISAAGVFSAFADLNYDKDLIELVGGSPITRLNSYTLTPSGDFSVPGLINELGAVQNSLQPSNIASQPMLEILFRAKAAGQAEFTTDAADTSGKEFLVYLDDSKPTIPANRITYGTASLAVGRNFDAVNDSFNFNEDSTNNSLNVLANDTIVSGSNTVLTILSVGTPSANGTVTISSDGKSLIYTPASNFNGGETFTYVARDQNGTQATATVTIQVQPVNDPPIATADSFTFTQDSSGNFLDVLTNDTDGVDSGETLTVSAVGASSAGSTVTINSASNGILYTPKAGFVGTDTFTYTLRDNNGGTTTTTVTVTVNPLIPPPTPVNDAFTVVEDAASAEFNVLQNDLPSQTGETLTVTAGTGDKGGTVSVTTAKDKLIYRPAANFSGTEVVTYTLRGSLGGVTTGKATFTVTAVNDAPTATNDAAVVQSVSTAPVDVLANDANVDSGETYTIQSVTQPASGQGIVAIVNGKIQYTAPSADFEGTVTFTYTIADGSNLTSTATVTLTVQNFTPRSIGGTIDIVSGSSDALISLSGLTVQYTGQSLTGQTITNSATVATDGSFSLPNLPPGSYTLSIPDLPFLTPANSTATITSGRTDGNTSAVKLAVGTLETKYVSVMDFLGTNLIKGMSTAISPGQTQSWVNPTGGWRVYKSIQLTLNTAGDTLSLRVTDSSNNVFTGSVSLSNSQRVSVRATEGTAKLVRLLAEPTDIQLTQSNSSTAAATQAALSTNSLNSSTNSSSSSNSTSNNSSNSNSSTSSNGLSGEGEASSPASSNRSSTAASTSTDTSSTNSLSTDSADSVFASDIDEMLKKKK